MKILFYQLNSKDKALESWKTGKYFGHTLFGATHFHKHDINVVMFKNGKIDPLLLKIKKVLKIDFRLFFHAFRILFLLNKYDVVYAPYPRGLEFLILLRSLGLFKRPIVIYGHQTLRSSKNIITRSLLKLFYSGVDKILFFSNIHFEESIGQKMTLEKKLFKINWGPDLQFYDQAINEVGSISQEYYLSIGKSRRDYLTLIEAFKSVKGKLKLYVDSAELQEQLRNDILNIEVSYLPVSVNSPYDLVGKISKATAITICTQKVKGLNGITNLYEAMAMSKPVIITRNKYIDIDVEKEKIGLVVEVGDVKGWEKAIDFFDKNPEEGLKYGLRGRALCEQGYNLEIFTKQVAEILKM